MVSQQRTTIASSDWFQLSDATAKAGRYRSIVTMDEVTSDTGETIKTRSGIRIKLTSLAGGIPHLLSDRFM